MQVFEWKKCNLICQNKHILSMNLRAIYLDCRSLKTIQIIEISQFNVFPSMNVAHLISLIEEIFSQINSVFSIIIFKGFILFYRNVSIALMAEPNKCTCDILHYGKNYKKGKNYPEEWRSNVVKTFRKALIPKICQLSGYKRNKVLHNCERIELWTT